jgi:regulatory protein
MSGRSQGTGIRDQGSGSSRRVNLAFRSKSAKPREPLDEPALFDYAVKALGRRMKTEAELRRTLKGRAAPGQSGEAAVNAVVLRLKEMRYLNDAAFAETYARLRHENDKLGARRVRRDLQQKGIGSGLIAEAVDARYAGADEEKLARAHLERRGVRKPKDEREMARVARRLIAAGFSTGTIYKILREWDVPEEDLVALESLEEESSSGE